MHDKREEGVLDERRKGHRPGGAVVASNSRGDAEWQSVHGSREEGVEVRQKQVLSPRSSNRRRRSFIDGLSGTATETYGDDGGKEDRQQQVDDDEEISAITEISNY